MNPVLLMKKIEELTNKREEMIQECLEKLSILNYDFKGEVVIKSNNDSDEKVKLLEKQLADATSTIEKLKAENKKLSAENKELNQKLELIQKQSVNESTECVVDEIFEECFIEEKANIQTTTSECYIKSGELSNNNTQFVGVVNVLDKEYFVKMSRGFINPSIIGGDEKDIAEVKAILQEEYPILFDTKQERVTERILYTTVADRKCCIYSTIDTKTKAVRYSGYVDDYMFTYCNSANNNRGALVKQADFDLVKYGFSGHAGNKTPGKSVNPNKVFDIQQIVNKLISLHKDMYTEKIESQKTEMLNEEMSKMLRDSLKEKAEQEKDLIFGAKVEPKQPTVPTFSSFDSPYAIKF